VRLLVIYLPGGIEEFFAEAARELPPPPESPPDVERLAAIAERYGMEMAPPPEN
jgi:hypothetical protein